MPTHIESRGKSSTKMFMQYIKDINFEGEYDDIIEYIHSNHTGKLGELFSEEILGNEAFDNNRLNFIIAYILDRYWESWKTTYPLMALDEIENSASILWKSHKNTCYIAKNETTIANITIASVKMLRFLYEAYIDHLKSKFVGCFLIGSISYGRFFNVRNTAEHRSDLDLLVIAPDEGFKLSDFLFENWVLDLIDNKRVMFLFMCQLEWRGYSL